MCQIDDSTWAVLLDFHDRHVKFHPIQSTKASNTYRKKKQNVLKEFKKYRSFEKLALLLKKDGTFGFSNDLHLRHQTFRIFHPLYYYLLAHLSTTCSHKLRAIVW